MEKRSDIVPENKIGAKSDTASFAHYSTPQEAMVAFRLLKDRLLNVSQWHAYSGTGTADFQLTDEQGNAVQRLAREGDYFRISIPGPGSMTGSGFDWVKIIKIIDEAEPEKGFEQVAIQVQPASNPLNQDESVAHFFDESASSTFLARREHLTLSAEVHGRNEQPNTSTEKTIDKARNLLVAAGAMIGFSELQWKSLVNGLINAKS